MWRSSLNTCLFIYSLWIHFSVASRLVERLPKRLNFPYLTNKRHISQILTGFYPHPSPPLRAIESTWSGHSQWHFEWRVTTQESCGLVVDIYSSTTIEGAVCLVHSRNVTKGENNGESATKVWIFRTSLGISLTWFLAFCKQWTGIFVQKANFQFWEQFSSKTVDVSYWWFGRVYTIRTRIRLVQVYLRELPLRPIALSLWYFHLAILFSSLVLIWWHYCSQNLHAFCNILVSTFLQVPSRDTSYSRAK